MPEGAARGLARAHEGDVPAVDVGTEQVQQRRQQGRSSEHRDRHHEHRGRRHRLDGAHRHDPDGAERDEHGESREDHRPARRAHGVHDGVLASGAGPEFLAEAREHEQRVVDGDPEADHRDHRLGVHRDLGLGREDAHDRERDHHRHDAEHEGQRRRDYSAEEREQDHEDDRQADRLGRSQVALRDVLERRVDGPLPQHEGADGTVRDLELAEQALCELEGLVLAEGREAGDRLHPPT